MIFMIVNRQGFLFSEYARKEILKPGRREGIEIGDGKI